MLLQAHNWAGWEQTKRSYELYARFVMPHFTDANRNRISSYDSVRKDFEALQEERQKGVDLAFAKWSDRSKHRP
jgi:limonene 1,2-monooxygenase